jgi:hypothetical protein
MRVTLDSKYKLLMNLCGPPYMTKIKLKYNTRYYETLKLQFTDFPPSPIAMFKNKQLEKIALKNLFT